MKKCFKYIWVAGIQQYEYAKKLGFKNSQIIQNLLTANTSIFKYAGNKDGIYRDFLYVGNFKKIKGTDILIEAFEIYKNKYKGTWTLTCYGEGELKHLLTNREDVEVKKFASQKTLSAETKNYGAYILPSRLDQWGVALHEFALQGLPIIASSKVGAANTFVINNFNGYIFDNEDVEDLAFQMHRMQLLSNLSMLNFKRNSSLLGQRITVEIAAASFLSVI